MNRTRLKVLLVKDEGMRNFPYKDTDGHLTIGVGRNLEDRGLSDDEVAFLLDNDILRVWEECSTFPYFGSLDETRQHAIMDMVFNLGLPRFLKFEQLGAALEARDFEKAAAEMLDSVWAKQVGERATRLAGMMRTGVV